MDVRLYSGGFRRAPERPVNHSCLVKTIYNASIHPLLLKPKAVAFDLDETIGSFSDLYIIWCKLHKEMQTQFTFNKLLDLYPEFLRIGILHILEFLKTKIVGGQCLPIFIYTNNQCEDVSWVERIISYLESHVSNNAEIPDKLFARPICAFKINRVRVEPNRTTHEKTYKDFIRCSMLKRTDLCFIDDASHDKMKHKRVYYIQPPPYFHTLSRPEVIDRVMRSDLSKILRARLDLEIPEHPHINKSLFEKREQEIANKIMYYMREYFFVSMRRCVTKKTGQQIGRFSRKIRRI